MTAFPSPRSFAASASAMAFCIRFLWTFPLSFVTVSCILKSTQSLICCLRVAASASSSTSAAAWNRF